MSFRPAHPARLERGICPSTCLLCPDGEHPTQGCSVPTRPWYPESAAHGQDSTSSAAGHLFQSSETCPQQTAQPPGSRRTERRSACATCSALPTWAHRAKCFAPRYLVYPHSDLPSLSFHSQGTSGAVSGPRLQSPLSANSRLLSSHVGFVFPSGCTVPLQDLSSLIRDGAWVPSSESPES